jgi:hypothetical protein
MNLRDLAERDLSVSLEGDWGVPVALLSPQGVWQRTRAGSDDEPLTGQVLYDTVRLNPETGERVVIPAPIVVLRRSSLTQVPVAGETWLVEAPIAPTAGAAVVQFVLSPTRPPEGGSSIGFIRLYLQAVEQSTEG